MICKSPWPCCWKGTEQYGIQDAGWRISGVFVLNVEKNCPKCFASRVHLNLNYIYHRVGTLIVKYGSVEYRTMSGIGRVLVILMSRITMQSLDQQKYLKYVSWVLKITYVVSQIRRLSRWRVKCLFIIDYDFLP